MWVLPHAGGPYMEGLSSCDYSSRMHFPLDIPSSEPKTGYLLNDVPYPDGHKPEEKSQVKNEENSEEMKNLDEESVSYNYKLFIILRNFYYHEVAFI